MSLKKLGRYDLVRVLGKGAMGLVYEGRDPNLDRRVAIKTIKVENLSDEAAAEYEVRFRTEARSAARLQHPNIVSVYDSDRDIDIAYLVMEFVEGDDLKHHLDKGQVYTLQQTLSIMTELLSALDYAHQQKIVHRDIKPANLLVQASGSIKLADFGVARIQDSGDATRTQGSIVGTLKYMSPEQLEGRPIDARADLFAAGVVLYQLLTSQRPFDGDTDFAVIQKIVNHTPAAATSFNPKLPPAIDAVVAKALAKSRDMRYATALDFSTALQAASKEASDITITPAAVVPARSSNTTWTATMMPGESLLTTESGVGVMGSTGSSITSGTSASLVTQEVELVYWKDIKESNDIEDFQGFLVKFPSGIYADLARRRMKNLGVDMPNESTLVIPRTLTPALAAAATPLDTRSTTQTATEPAADIDKTLLLPQRDAAQRSTPSDSAKPAVNIIPATSQASATPVAPATSPKKTVWLVAGLVALAVAGVAFQLFSGPSATPETALATPPASSASQPLPAVSSAVPAVPALAAQGAVSAAVMPALAAASASRPAVSAPGFAARAVLAASRAAAASVAKKGAPDTDKPKKDETAPTDAAPQTASAKPATTPGSPPVGSSPRAACEDRILLGFQNCMSEQCAKPAFTQHPICIERRAMDERRREAERNR